MKRLPYVIGYHGCDQAVANKVIRGNVKLIYSDQPYDWLGSGIYFWESDLQRAYEFACWKRDTRRGSIKNPAIIGAAIDLGRCLDLTVRENIDVVAGGYRSLKKQLRAAGETMPKNENSAGDPNADRLLRYRDKAVIDHVHQTIEIEAKGSATAAAKPYDTVRGTFTEGPRAYPGAGFFEKTHTQIAVRNYDCILGVFHAPNP